jgi:hypothetical protein
MYLIARKGKSSCHINTIDHSGNCALHSYGPRQRFTALESHSSPFVTTRNRGHLFGAQNLSSARLVVRRFASLFLHVLD